MHRLYLSANLTGLLKYLIQLLVFEDIQISQDHLNLKIICVIF